MNKRQFLLWLPMILIAFANATLRQLVFIPAMNELRAHQLSTITLTIFCAIYIAAIFPRLKIENKNQALLVGFIWMLLTVLFEFSLGLLTNRSWAMLFHDYDLSGGRIWPLFLFCLLLLPFAFYKIRKKPGK